MFPDSFGPPQPDWPPQMKLAGFPMYDGPPGGDLLPEVLRFCLAGDPPVVFTFGTGMVHAAGMFRERGGLSRAREAWHLVDKVIRQVPSPLPPSVEAFEFAPFLRLFPHCAAVVHHGGIGTVAKALMTGTPQLIFPMAFDQFDNAARVKRVGAGESLKSGRWKIDQMVDALTRLMSNQSTAHCGRIAERFRGDDSFEAAAELVEELAHRPRRPP